MKTYIIMGVIIVAVLFGVYLVMENSKSVSPPSSSPPPSSSEGRPSGSDYKNLKL